MHLDPVEILPPAPSGIRGDDVPVAASGEAVRLVRDGPVPRAACPHCGGALALGTVGERWQIRRPSDVADRLLLQLGALEREELHVLLLNTRNVVIDQVRIYEGNVSVALVRIGELFAEAVRRQARAILLVHNHPSGDPTPSADDLHLTAEAIAAGRLLDIDVLDHVIVGATTWVSLRERGVAFEARPHGHEAAETGRRDRGDDDRLRLHVDAAGQVVDDAGTVYDVQAAIDALNWKTPLRRVPAAPHQYSSSGARGRGPRGTCSRSLSPSNPTRSWLFTVAIGSRSGTGSSGAGGSGAPRPAVRTVA